MKCSVKKYELLRSMFQNCSRGLQPPFIWVLLLRRSAGVIKDDTRLALLVHKVPIVLFADVLGDRPVAVACQSEVCSIWSRQSLGICDRSLDTHRVGPCKPEAFDDPHVAAVGNPWRELREWRKP